MTSTKPKLTVKMNTDKHRYDISCFACLLLWHIRTHLCDIYSCLLQNYCKVTAQILTFGEITRQLNGV